MLLCLPSSGDLFSAGMLLVMTANESLNHGPLILFLMSRISIICVDLIESRNFIFIDNHSIAGFSRQTIEKKAEHSVILPNVGMAEKIYSTVICSQSM